MISRFLTSCRAWVSSGNPRRYTVAKKYFYVQSLQKAVRALENSRESTLAEIRSSAGARQNVRTEMANVRHELAIYEAALARHDKAPANGRSRGAW
jgi:hypothetical protein